ncbi:MAG: pilus assembly protein N-terminal domain-containing protein [Pseudorhodoplanes sp.]
MTALVEWRFRRLRSCACLALLAGATILASAAMAAPEAVTVILDQARLVKVPDRVSTIVIGNPLIADVSLQPGGMMVMTGKGYGVTSITALDRSGTVLMEKQVEVRMPPDAVVVYKGIERESYSCTPQCSRRITLGDGMNFFEQALAQTGNRTGMAVGVAAK